MVRAYPCILLSSSSVRILSPWTSPPSTTVSPVFWSMCFGLYCIIVSYSYRLILNCLFLIEELALTLRKLMGIHMTKTVFADMSPLLL